MSTPALTFDQLTNPAPLDVAGGLLLRSVQPASKFSRRLYAVAPFETSSRTVAVISPGWEPTLVIERADLRTLAGSIDLEAELAPGARVYGKSYSGSITLTLPEDTSAQFDVQSFSGGIRNELGPSGAASSGVWRPRRGCAPRSGTWGSA